VVHYRNPVPTVDILVHIPGRGVVLIKRKNEPLGWALPGGFVDYGESVETAAVREAREEIGLDVELTGILGVYSDPFRDPRQHTMSVVFTAQPVDVGALEAGDDAGGLDVFPVGDWPSPLCFDHARILDDYARRFHRFNRS
jgi:8-oxo-dGTP diphosphatase